ncbi:MAG: hypothetical protein AAGA56_24660, partial [Myxococcota bacterium]
AVLDDDIAEEEDYRDVFEILVSAPAELPEAVAKHLAGSRVERGKLIPSFALYQGELEIALDENEELRALVGAVAPFVRADQGRDPSALEDARAYLQGGADLPEIASLLGRRLLDSMKQQGKISVGYIRTQVERSMVSGRHYRSEPLFGGSFLRGTLSRDEESPSVTVYLPADLKGELPLFRRFRARVIAQALPPSSEFAPSAPALRIYALGRLIGEPVR